jgi:hypothetical protein
MAAGEVRAGKAFVEITARDKVRAVLDKISGRLRAFGRGVSMIGASLLAASGAALTPLISAAKMFSDVGDQIAKMSARTGVSVEALSELGFAAEQSGSDLETIEKGLRTMQRVLGDAAQGSTMAQEALTTLGLSFDDLKDLTPEQQFKLLADRLSRIEDPTLRAAAAMKVFGKSGTQLLPLLANGAAGIEALQAQARNLGLTISSTDAKKAEELNDQLGIMWRTLKSNLFAAGAAVADLLIDFVNRVSTLARATAAWVNANRPLVATLAKIAAIVGVVGGVLVAVGGMATLAGLAFAGLSALVTAATVALGAIAAVIGAILTPVGAVSVAVVALAGYLIYASGSGGKALAWLGDVFNQLKDTATKTFGGIADALAAGDLALAGRILWLALKMEWQRGIAALNEVWIGFKDTFFSALDSVWAFFKKGWNEAVGFVAGIVARIMKLVDPSMDLEGTLSILEEETDAANRDADRERQKSAEERAARNATAMQESQAALDQARKEWAEALAQASKEREETGIALTPPELQAPNLPDITEQLNQRAESVQGTFSAAAARNLGRAGGPAERTAKACEAMQDDLASLLREAQHGGLEFA